jgi:DedD protein
MADRIEENTDLAVSEFRRKARRRLLGAIVLALGAAILLPLLLEKEQRPLGDDVSIQIPPVDNGKFVSRLSPEKAKDAKSDANAAAKSGEAASPAPPVVPARTNDAPTVGAAGMAPSGAAPAAAPRAPPPESATRPIAPAPQAVAVGATAEPAPQATPAVKDQTTPATAAAAAPAAVTASAAPAADTGAPAAAAVGDSPRKPEGFIIQLAAFTDDKGANAFANKVKKLGYPAYTEPVQTSHGTLWRVRVGGYPTRAAANEALANLKATGRNGLVSAVK